MSVNAAELARYFDIDARLLVADVWPEFAIWTLVDPEFGVINYAGGLQDVRTTIQIVAELYRNGGTKEDFEAAARKAMSVWAKTPAGAVAAAVWTAEHAARVAITANASPMGFLAGAASATISAGREESAWKDAAKKKLIEIVNRRKRHRYMQVSPHGFCEKAGYCVEHEIDSSIEACT